MTTPTPKCAGSAAFQLAATSKEGHSSSAAFPLIAQNWHNENTGITINQQMLASNKEARAALASTKNKLEEFDLHLTASRPSHVQVPFGKQHVAHACNLMFSL